MPTGTVKWFNTDKGYGFILAEGGDDVFVHANDIEPSSPQPLNEGDKVQFEVVEELRGPKAVQVRVLSSRSRRDRSELGKPPPRRVS
jgi:CspA family cold shock protein